MCFINLLQSKKKSFQELLDKLLKKEKDQIRSIEEQIEKILVKLHRPKRKMRQNKWLKENNIIYIS